MGKKKIRLTVGQASGQWMRHVAVKCRPNTVKGYQVIIRQFVMFIGEDTPMREIGANDIEAYLLQMGSEMVSPPGVAPRPPRRRAAKTLRNMHIGLSSFWTWAVKSGVASKHVVQAVEPPAVHRKPIDPLSAAQIKRLLDGCKDTREWQNDIFVRSARPTAVRDRIIILLLIEACLRVSELINLRISDVTLGRSGGEVYVRDGKGGKDRIVPIGRRANAAVGDYLLTRPDARPDDYLIINEHRNHGKPMTRGTVAKLIRRLGAKVGIDVHPHLLRITGACMLVSNGATAWDVRLIMGHSDVQTTQRYVEAAQVDLQASMARHSPVDNLRL